MMNFRYVVLVGLLAVTTVIMAAKPAIAQQAPKSIPLCADFSFLPSGVLFPGQTLTNNNFVFRASRLVTLVSASVTGLSIPGDRGLKVKFPNHASSVSFVVGTGNGPLDIKAFDVNMNLVAQRTIPKTMTPVDEEISNKGEISHLLFEKGSYENVVSKVCIEPCDPSLDCLQVLTCVDGKRYRTLCGPKNCDKHSGECEVEK